MATATRVRSRRRGVVLILVLAMLSIMALIGVTFASLSGQAQVGARYFAEGRDVTSPGTYFDYALNQLINDTNNPKSALRGHSLLRDMYGHPDPVIDVVSGQWIGRRGGYVPRLPAPFNLPLTFTNVAYNAPTRVYTVTTNIPTLNNAEIGQMPSLYGANFTGWVLRLQQWAYDANGNGRQLVPPVGQTFEIVADDYSGPYHVFRLSAADVTTPNLVRPDSPLILGLPPGFTTWANVFELDGRYLGAFNGTGMSMPNVPNSIPPDRVNFLYNNPLFPGAYYDPDAFNPAAPLNPAFSSPSMDEDYDAVDHENMFLAWQSADGEVMIPSFHRPNQIVYDPANTGANDWADPTNIARSKFLRPRRLDHPGSGDSFPDLIPDPGTGKIAYDVDNDGDGVTDSVWIDLGFPAQRSKDGKLFKPLFSFMVIGLNGRIPLNTAGNLQRRALANLDKDGNGTIDLRTNANNQLDLFLSDAYAGWPMARHASHLGYSPFEVNPGYGLTTPLGLDGPNAYELNRNRDGQQLLLQLLTGVGDPNLAQVPVPGRYGEPEVFSLAAQTGYVGRFPGAGRSYNLNPFATDLIDSNFNAYDFFPQAPGPELPLVATDPRTADYRDAANRPLLPVERMRHFLTPIDLTGSGLVMPWDTLPAAFGDFGRGSDRMGRVGYFQYYRPAGVASAALPPDRAAPAGLSGERIYDPTLPNEVPGLNVLHGYESHRNPAGRPAAPPAVAAREFMARAPFNVGDNRTLPTFDGQINSANPILQSPPAPAPPAPFTMPTQIVQGMYPNGSLGLNEDVQLNLYRREPYDDIFGAQDLEWLYRRQDTDGTSLTSRLEALAQLPQLAGTFRAFVDDDTTLDAGGARLGIDALTRRRLFAIDFWELNRFAWSQNYFVPGNTPALGHGNRKINLNYPLPPIDNSTPLGSSEPVRLKWISEAYALMKQVLYPGFVQPGTGAPGEPRPEDFARLGQFAVNIIDFRDPDDVMTRWVNPDLKVRPAEGFGYDDGQPPANEPAGVAWAGDASVPGNQPVVQWGMEYLPVTINEVLAYQFQAKNGNTQTTVKRLFVELANILTEDSDGDTGQNGQASDLYLRGWGLLITPDDPTANPALPLLRGERPNTVTGQLDLDALKAEVIPLAGAKGDPPTFNPLPAPVRALDSNDDDVDALPDQNGPGNDNHYLLANAQPIPNAELNPPNPDAVLSDDLVAQLPTLPIGSGEARYFWIHLVRPANPHAVNLQNEPLVVVDSFRFPYRDAGIRVDASNPNDEVTVPAYPPGSDPPAASTRAIYSVGRHQPLRGGHAVPDSHQFSPPYPYGWSEQTAADRGVDTNGDDPADIRGRYPVMVNGNPTPTSVTAPIHHTLGFDNRLENGGPSPRENWDHFPFLDRDFASVTELLLVPDCPPGLFTKVFTEESGRPDPADAGDGFPGAYPHVTPPAVFESGLTAATSAGGLLDWPPYLPDPHPFPYLPQRFFYTAVPPAAPGPPPTPSPDRAGWFRFFEFFEVPSPVTGAIGPVAEGDNFDWLRQDLRPGALNLNLIIDEEAFFALVDDPRLNLLPLASGAAVPRVVSAIDPTGAPTASYPMSDLSQYPLGRGFHAPAGVPPGTYMKSAFADFLKLRHGGSGLIGASPASALPPKPFRSPTAFSPSAGLDIYDTVFRPARLEAYEPNLGLLPDRTSIPPRRLFQVADRYDAGEPLTLIDPASELGNFPGQAPLTPSHINLANPNANLFGSATAPPDATLGSAGGPGDRRRHPLWQGEMIQKVMNNSTVRTHQFAVWVTVGFFEVLEEGDATKVTIDPNLAIDRLGKEIGRDTGQQVRYRGFFLVDRTRATAFDPRNPADFRDLIVYRRTIE